MKVIHPANVTNIEDRYDIYDGGNGNIDDHYNDLDNDTDIDSIMHINETLHALVNKVKIIYHRSELICTTIKRK